MTDIDTLAATIRAGLDETERIARAVDDNSPPWDGRWAADGNHALRTYNGWVLAYRAGREFVPGLLAHWVRHDPETVLRRVARDRQLLDLLLAEKHHFCDDPGYNCAALGWNGKGSTGDPCDCGRDERVTAYLTVLAAGAGGEQR